jgi:hypothetical protein
MKRIPLARQIMMQELGVVSAVAIPILIELGYQIYKYIRSRKDEENGREKEDASAD